MSELEIYKGMVKKMKDDEIKEILNAFKEILDNPTTSDECYDGRIIEINRSYDLDLDEIKTLLDYITNLQQENERLLKQLEDVSLDEANIRADLMLEQVDYKARCEKAIEYIQKTKFCDNDECCILNETWFGKKLLNILNGSDE